MALNLQGINIGSVNPQSAMIIAIWFIFTIFLIGILIGAFLWIRWWLRYKYTAISITYTDDGTPVPNIRKAALLKQRGETFLKFAWSKEKILPPDPNFFYPNEGRGKSVFLKKYGHEDYQPFNMLFDSTKTEPGLLLEPVPQELHNYNSEEAQNEMNRYNNQSFWDKYGAIIVPLTAILIVTIIFIFGLREMRQTGVEFRAAAEAIRQGLEAMSKQTIPAGP